MLLADPVAEAAQGRERGGSGAARPQLGAQPASVGVQGRGQGRVVAAPDPPHQLLTRDGSADLFGQHVE